MKTNDERNEIAAEKEEDPSHRETLEDLAASKDEALIKGGPGQTVRVQFRVTSDLSL